MLKTVYFAFIVLHNEKCIYLCSTILNNNKKMDMKILIGGKLFSFKEYLLKCKSDLNAARLIHSEKFIYSQMQNRLKNTYSTLVSFNTSWHTNEDFIRLRWEYVVLKKYLNKQY